MQIVDVFRARIVDVTNASLIIEITGDEEKIEGFIEVLRPWGIIEMVRTGVVAMARGISSVVCQWSSTKCNWQLLSLQKLFIYKWNFISRR